MAGVADAETGLETNGVEDGEEQLIAWLPAEPPLVAPINSTPLPLFLLLLLLPCCSSDLLAENESAEMAVNGINEVDDEVVDDVDDDDDDAPLELDAKPLRLALPLTLPPPPLPGAVNDGDSIMSVLMAAAPALRWLAAFSRLPTFSCVFCKCCGCLCR